MIGLVVTFIGYYYWVTNTPCARMEELRNRLTAVEFNLRQADADLYRRKLASKADLYEFRGLPKIQKELSDLRATLDEIDEENIANWRARKTKIELQITANVCRP